MQADARSFESAIARGVERAGESADSGPELTDWLQALGGLGALLATVVLIVLAARQMKHIREQASAAGRQARAASEQVELMAKEAAAAETRRENEAVERARQQMVRDSQVASQLAALTSVAVALRDGARAQLQPIVFAHEWKGPLYGPSDEADLGEDQVEFRYYLSNEGLGPALKVAHGIELGGVPFAFGGGMQFRTARAGEFLPPLDDGATQPVPTRYLGVTVSASALPAEYGRRPVVYWCRFENVFGERFETRNTADPYEPAEFRRVKAPARSVATPDQQ